MKKFILFIFICVIGKTVFSQDTVRLVHKNYTTVFSKSKKYPVLVEWWVTKQKVTCSNPIPRSDKFLPDPLLKEETNLQDSYTKSGFDRGHMSPAADNQCSGKDVLNESFYFTNMSPQYHSLNAGDWKKLEMETRELSKKFDSVRVWCGNVGEIKKIGQVSVPELCWKVIYIKSQNKYEYYIFKNTKDKPNGLEDEKVTLEQFNKRVGNNFSSLFTSF
jgi:endonuclease G